MRTKCAYGCTKEAVVCVIPHDLLVVSYLCPRHFEQVCQGQLISEVGFEFYFLHRMNDAGTVIWETHRGRHYGLPVPRSE